MKTARKRNGSKFLSLLRRSLQLGLITLALALAFRGSASAASYENGVYQDLAPGYNDDVIVTVVVRDGQMVQLDAKNRNGQESEYFQRALEGLRQAILEKQGVDGVEAVSGATGTSESILSAMKGVLEQAQTAPGSAGAVGSAETNGSAGIASRPAVTPLPTLDPAKAEVFTGLGSNVNFRVGPGKDADGGQVYSFNVVMANVLFDSKGRILDVRADVYEISTPNYDGESMPHFSGWPGQTGYAVADHATGKPSGASQLTEESAAVELAQWRTKRERGATYGMNPQNEWDQQMNAYEQWMIGKTVEELRAWFSRNTSPRNGRPIKASSEDQEDRQLLASLSQKEKEDLVDLTSMATMSLSDSHGLILEAIEKAWQNKTPVLGVEKD